MAEFWAQTTSRPRVFCRFDDAHFRWGSAYVERGAHSFMVERDGDKQELASMDAVAGALGTSSDLLSRWLALASQTRTYCIEDGGADTVQVILEGSDWNPYGFRYALNGKPAGLALLEHEAKIGGIENTDTRVEPVFGRWFYFESRR
jgi:hypothetical protein